MKKYLLTACISLFFLCSYAQTARVADTQKKNNDKAFAAQMASEGTSLKKDTDIPVASQLKGHKEDMQKISDISRGVPEAPNASQLKGQNSQSIQPANKDEKQKLPKN